MTQSKPAAAIAAIYHVERDCSLFLIFGEMSEANRDVPYLPMSMP